MNSQHSPHHYSARIALGARLRNWRQRENFSISNAASQLGVSTATWGHWETGQHLPSGDLLLAIEILTGMPLYVLFCPHLETCPAAKGGLVPSEGQPCCQRGATIPRAGGCCDHP